MPTDLFLNYRTRSPEFALVKSAEVLDELTFPAITAGNKIRFRIFLVDGTGSYETFSGDGTYSLKVSIGTIETGTAIATQNTWASEAVTVNGVATSCWVATIDASVAGVTNFVSGLRSKDAQFEVQLSSPAAAEIRTICQQRTTILNKLVT